MLRRLIGSLLINAGSDDDFEILVAIDTDDPAWEGRSLLPYHNVRYYRWPRPRTLGAKLNRLASEAKGDILFFIANDMLMATRGWPQKVREGVARLPASRIGVPFANSTLSPGEPTYPVITRETMNAVGHFMNPAYPYWFIDTEWGEIGRMIGQLFVIDVTLTPQPGSGKTHGLVDLSFWCRYFKAMRPKRIEVARRILGAEVPMELVTECARRTAHLLTPEFLARWSGNADSPPSPDYKAVKDAATIKIQRLYSDLAKGEFVPLQSKAPWIVDVPWPADVDWKQMPWLQVERNRDRYIDLLESVLTGTLTRDPSIDPWSNGTYEAAKRATGRDWPATALTMIGTQRMRQLRQACEEVLRAGIPGDFIETGVWRGGACIYMAAILEAWEATDRMVYAADSFQGLPRPIVQEDHGDPHHTYQQLIVPLNEVEDNFRRFGVEARISPIKGWFDETLPGPVKQLAILRLDGDMYGSTWAAITALYPLLSPGGICIVDDYFLGGCQKAIHDYRSREGITAEIMPIDGLGVWWRK